MNVHLGIRPLLAFVALYLCFALASSIAVSQERVKQIEGSDRTADRVVARSKPELLNADQYVGSDQCVTCHLDQYQGYVNTLHNKTAHVTDVTFDPGPGEFIHRPSHNRYEVSVTADKMFHTEHRLDLKGQPMGETQYSMALTLGSGTNSTSYLAKIGAFHVESPITYFSEENEWSMSPGYESPSQLSFRRAVTVGCVFCHVGSIKQLNGNPYKFEISEATIGCERCHGPGMGHSERHRGNVTSIEDSIVNPRSLSRELSEAICQQCHCQGAVELSVTSKGTWDFRPGHRLTDYRVDYQFLHENSDSMSLVGHVEQLHHSKCYTETETLTCITCHDPHASPAKERRVEFHREKCLQCHQDESCGVERKSRLESNDNNCAACHMPRKETNVAHFALHNHRIGIHRETSEPSAGLTTEVKPILDIGHLSQTEQKRLSGLAKYELLRRRGGDPNFAALMPPATAELINLKNLGAADGEVDAALVWLAWEQGETVIAESIAREILTKETAETNPRIVASHTLARIHMDRGEFKKAIPIYKDLENMHRDSSHSYFRGLAEQNIGNSEKAIEALNRSLQIDPSQIAAHRALQAIYHSIDRADLADRHEQSAIQNELRRSGKSSAAP